MILIPEKTEAEKKAQKKYMSKYTIINVRMTPEKKQRLQDHVDQLKQHDDKISLNSFINLAIDKMMKKDKER